jgi:glycosyltransferase involved in cell wall biosynthesis
MKILFVLEHYHPYIGGAETLFQLLAEALAEQHEVRVITTRYRAELPARETRRSVDIRRINCRNRFLFSVMAVPAVIRWARWAEVVHTTTYNAALPAWVGAKVAGKKVIVTFHEVWGKLWTRLPFLSRPAAWAFRLFERLLLALPFDRYVAVSDFTARTLVQYGVDESRVVRIHNGLDYADFEGYNHQPPAQFTYTYFGRLGVSKGLELLLPAAAAFRDRHPDSCLRLIIPRRPAAMFRTITDLIAHHQLGDYVELLHELPIEALRHRVSTSSCVVIPSYSEGFCFVAAEAVAMNVPIVSSGQGALAETVSGRHVTMAGQTANALADALEIAYQGQWTETKKASYPLSQSVREYEAFYEGM